MYHAGGVFLVSDASYQAKSCILRQGLVHCRVGTTFQGKYSDSIKAAYVYPSSNFLDDLTWGAAWLYRKTGEQQFLLVTVQPPPPCPSASCCLGSASIRDSIGS